MVPSVLVVSSALAMLAVGLSAAPLRAQAASSGVHAGPWPTPPAERCAPASGDAAALLDRAWRAAGLDHLTHAVAHRGVIDVQHQSYMSDRPYPPFFSYATEREIWLDPTTGVERATSRLTGLMIPATMPSTTTLSTEAATFRVRDTILDRVASSAQAQLLVTRALDVWAVLHDWRAATDARVAARCTFRDYPRIVLERQGEFGPERLYLDPKSGLPVKLDREETHYLWGQLHVEYEYQTWLYGDGTVRPGAVFRLVDGALDVERIERAFAIVPADSAPGLRVPPSSASPTAAEPPRFLQAIASDTVRAGAHVLLLHNAAYTEGVVLARDTVFVLDATQGEGRARADSAWIARIAPYHRAVVVVVTDLAWPHIAGVRFWVARGATIVSRATSRPMLERVIARRWTRQPDLLERLRRRGTVVRFRFVAVGDSLVLGGGAVRLYPIDGVASEGALMAWVPDDGVLWASDYIQDVTQPTLYAAEVVRAAARVGIAPRTAAAEHQAPVAWSVVQRLAAQVPR